MKAVCLGKRRTWSVGFHPDRNRTDMEVRILLRPEEDGVEAVPPNAKPDQGRSGGFLGRTFSPFINNIGDRKERLANGHDQVYPASQAC